jgi:XTP/dITP diphosphohydrolase
MKIQTLVAATGNPGKAAEMETYLAGYVERLELKPAELEIEETGTTFLENACLKASQVALALNQWAIADDSGLTVAALNGAPGLHSARYGRTDQERIDRVLGALGDNPERRGAFICALALARPDGTILCRSEGVCQGEILKEALGSGGFGYDSIFWEPSQQMSFAQMTPELKRRISHRGQAFRNLLAQWPTGSTRD